MGPEVHPERRSGWRVALTSLENVQYRWLYASNMAFFFAMNGQQIVRAWIAYQLTQSELALGFVTFAVALPMLLVAPLGGVVADRVDRRWIIIGGQALIILSEFTIWSLLALGRLEFWHLVVAATLMGSVFPFIMPARQAIVVDIVGKRGLPNAMALSMAGMNIARVAGPSSSAALIGVIGVEYTYTIGLALYVSAWLAMFGVERAPPPPRPKASISANILEGARYIRQNRTVLVLLFFGLVPMFLAMPFQTLLVVFAEEIWERGSAGLSLLSGVAGAGGVVGSVYLAWSGELHRRLRQMLSSMLGFGIALLLFALCPWFLLALPLVFVANVYQSIFGTVNNTSIQLLIPDDVRGRVSSFLMMSFSLPMLGTLPMSAVAEVYGAPVAVSLAAALATLIALLFYATSPALRGMDRLVQHAFEDS